jgi:hypothetical protein
MATKEAVRQPATRRSDEIAEAVIISGPRKGEIIVLDGDGELQVSPQVEAALDFCVKAAARAARSSKALRAESDLLLRDLREVNKRHGIA